MPGGRIVTSIDRACPGSAGWRPRSGGSIRSRRRRTRCARDRTSRGRKCRRFRRGRKTRRAIPRPACCESRFRPASGPIPRLRLLAHAKTNAFAGRVRLGRARAATDFGCCRAPVSALGRLQRLEQTHAVAENFVGNRLLVGQRFPSRKSLGGNSGEKGQIVDQIIDIVDMRTDDDQRGTGCWASAAAASAHDEPQTPSRVAACPASKLATTSAKPSCCLRRPTSSNNRSDAMVAVPALAIVRLYRAGDGIKMSGGPRCIHRGLNKPFLFLIPGHLQLFSSSFMRITARPRSGRSIALSPGSRFHVF